MTREDQLVAPIFVSGLRKSGTSMTRLLFDGHPATFTLPLNEFHFFRYTDAKPITSNRKPRTGTMAERVDAICADKWFQSHLPTGAPRALDGEAFEERLRKRLAGGLINDDKDLFEAMIASVVQSSNYYAGQSLSEIRPVIKGVHQAEFLPELLAWFPDLKFIYVLRNPYGQLNSAINNMRHGNDGEEEKARIGVDHRKLDKRHPYPFLGQRLLEMRNSYYFMRKWSALYPDNFRVLVYDHLLADPEPQMRSTSEWLGLEFDPCLLEVTENHGTPMARHGWSVSGNHEAGRLSTKPLHAWKEQMPAGVVRLVSLHFDDILETYGFEVERPTVSRWRRFDRSERPEAWLTNRFLFTPAARRMLS